MCKSFADSISDAGKEGEHASSGLLVLSAPVVSSTTPPLRVSHTQCTHGYRELSHPNIVSTYDFGWADHEVNSLLSVSPEAAAMVILMEYCNLKALATNIAHTNRFGHYQVGATPSCSTCSSLITMSHCEAPWRRCCRVIKSSHRCCCTAALRNEARAHVGLLEMACDRARAHRRPPWPQVPPRTRGDPRRHQGRERHAEERPPQCQFRSIHREVGRLGARATSQPLRAPPPLHYCLFFMATWCCCTFASSHR